MTTFVYHSVRRGVASLEMTKNDLFVKFCDERGWVATPAKLPLIPPMVRMMDCTFQAVKFAKYHGLGNDFILIDNRENGYQLTSGQIQSMCSRHVGIAADGSLEIVKPESKLCHFHSRFCISDD